MNFILFKTSIFFKVITAMVQLCSPFFSFLKILSLSNLYIQSGTQNHNPEIKSHTLHVQSQPGAPIGFYFILFFEIQCLGSWHVVILIFWETNLKNFEISFFINENSNICASVLLYSFKIGCKRSNFKSQTSMLSVDSRVLSFIIRNGRWEESSSWRHPNLNFETSFWLHVSVTASHAMTEDMVKILSALIQH